MSPFRTILFASDFSERSREAFRVACALAAEATTRVYVLHVVEPAHLHEEPLGFGDSGVIHPQTEERVVEPDSVKEKLCACHVPNRPIDLVQLVREGEASDVILRVAEELGADLIALGTHGRTGLQRLLAGSVAEAVLRKAKCPVLALRSAELGARVTQDIRGILHATDHSEECRGALLVARGLARDLGVRLVILHVTLPAETLPGVLPYVVDLRQEHAALEALRAQVEGPDLKAPVEVMLRRGNVDIEIRTAARQAECDLIVMGTHGRTGLRRLLMGSVAEAVLRGADCPVLAVRGPTPHHASAAHRPVALAL